MYPCGFPRIQDCQAIYNLEASQGSHADRACQAIYNLEASQGSHADRATPKAKLSMRGIQMGRNEIWHHYSSTHIWDWTIQNLEMNDFWQNPF
jgi:hypothetical protein